MVNITIFSVPIGAEEKVKEYAMIAIERFKKQVLIVPVKDIEAFEVEIDNIRVANSLNKKYEKEEIIVGESIIENGGVE